jgi:uncharacterized protein with HEPN domain
VNARDGLYLSHILEAIAAIGRFTAGGRAEFFASELVQSAVIRQIEIVGEAVKQLDSGLTREEPAVPWRQIAGARDRLIHGYFRVDLEAVWAMIERDLPTLAANVRRILERRA